MQVITGGKPLTSLLLRFISSTLRGARPSALSGTWTSALCGSRRLVWQVSCNWNTDSMWNGCTVNWQIIATVRKQSGQTLSEKVGGMIDHRSSFKNGNGCCNPADGELIPPGNPVMMLELWRYSCAQNWNQNALDDQQCKAILLVIRQEEVKQLLLQLRLLNLHLSTRLFHIVSLPLIFCQARCCKTPWRLPGYGALETHQVRQGYWWMWQSDHLAKACG